jgi:hypothetical protein
MKRLLILGALSAVLSYAQAPWIFADDGSGKYLGRLSTNQFDPDSTSNQFGRYGSPFSPDSINNQFGTYGSPFSPFSANNPFATQAPILVAPPLMPEFTPIAPMRSFSFPALAPLAPLAPIAPIRPLFPLW